MFHVLQILQIIATLGEVHQLPFSEGDPVIWLHAETTLTMTARRRSFFPSEHPRHLLKKILRQQKALNQRARRRSL
jgi:hypothetical protein